jgi:hypothetical protein
MAYARSAFIMMLALVLAVGATAIAIEFDHSVGASGAGPATFYGTVPTGIVRGQGVVAVISLGAHSTVCGSNTVQPDTLHGNVLSYAIDVAPDEQTAGCGKLGSVVQFYFTPAPGSPTGGSLAVDAGIWNGPGPVNKNLSSLQPALVRRALGGSVASDGAFPAPPPPTPTPTPAPPAIPTTAPTPVPPPAAVTFSDGTYIVGTDIPAGTFRTRIPVRGCYWERLRGFSGSLSDIIANDFANIPEVVTIAASDKGFKSDGCGTWTNDLSSVTSSPTSPFSDGTYIVGVDVAAGTWRTSGGPSCYWERRSGFGGTLDDILANNFGGGSQVVTISPSDKGFQSKDCGTWTRQ